MESSKVDIIPPKSLEDIKNEIIKDGNLKNLGVYYENADDKEREKLRKQVYYI